MMRRLILAGLLVLAGAPLAACDPKPVVKLVNATPSDVIVQVEPYELGDYRQVRTLYLKQGRSVGFDARTGPAAIVILAEPCAYTFSIPDDEQAINFRMGAVTTLRFGPDKRLYVSERAAAKQPPGWPKSPVRVACETI